MYMELKISKIVPSLADYAVNPSVPLVHKKEVKKTWMCDEILRLTRACKPRFSVQGTALKATSLLFLCKRSILEHSFSFGRLARPLPSSFLAPKTIRGYYNGRNISKPAISSVAYGRPAKAEQYYLRMLGTGVEYQTGFFIASVIKAINDYFYDCPEGQQLKKIPYNPY